MCYRDHRLTFKRHDPRYWCDSLEIAPPYRGCVAENAAQLRLTPKGDGVYTISNSRDSESTIQAVEGVMDDHDALRGNK